MKRNILLILALFLTTIVSAQRYYSKTARITFNSKAPLENIEAVNQTAQAIIDSKTGAVQFSAQVKGFEFQKKLMQQHFNENYLESDKYPKAEFKGSITNNSEVNYTKDGTYTAKVKGKLTIHGVTKDVENTGTIKVVGGKINTASSFSVLLTDYNIIIPAAVSDKVSKSVTITVNANLELMK